MSALVACLLSWLDGIGFAWGGVVCGGAVISTDLGFGVGGYD